MGGGAGGAREGVGRAGAGGREGREGLGGEVGGRGEGKRERREAAAADRAGRGREGSLEKARQVVGQEVVRKSQSLDRARAENRDKEQVGRVYGSSFDMGARARMETERNTREQARADKLVDSIASRISSDSHYRRRSRHGSAAYRTRTWARPIVRNDSGEEKVKARPSLPSLPQTAERVTEVTRTMQAEPRPLERPKVVRRK